MRCFVAIDIDDRLCGRIGKLQREFKKRLKNQAGIKWVEPELIHLTLKFLGDVEDTRAEEINQTLELVCAEHKGFELEFSTIGSFGRPPKVLWLGIEKAISELEKLVQDIEQAFEDLGFEKEQRPFSPHLTLARVKETRPDRQLPEVIDGFGKIDANAIKVDSVCFYKSQLTSAGPVYTLLKKINLR
jgi:2'-5' RNA ligase